MHKTELKYVILIFDIDFWLFIIIISSPQDGSEISFLTCVQGGGRACYPFGLICLHSMETLELVYVVGPTIYWYSWVNWWYVRELEQSISSLKIIHNTIHAIPERWGKRVENPGRFYSRPVRLS